MKTVFALLAVFFFIGIVAQQYSRKTKFWLTSVIVVLMVYLFFT